MQVFGLLNSDGGVFPEYIRGFLMTAFTNQCARRIRIMGTKGELKGDMESGTIEIIDFVNFSNNKWTFNLCYCNSNNISKYTNDTIKIFGKTKWKHYKFSRKYGT